MGTIDVKRTSARFDERCISRAAWARSKGINAAVFYRRLSGAMPISAPIAEMLKEDNLLVMEGEK